MPNAKGKVGVRIRRIVNDNNTRLKIKSTQIAERLMKHILGEIEMQSTQVTAALGLLKKTLPDLQATTLDINDSRKEVRELSEPELDALIAAAREREESAPASKKELH